VNDVIANITDALTKAAGTQKAARDAIDATQDDIVMAEDILNQVGVHLFFSVVFKHQGSVSCANASMTRHAIFSSHAIFPKVA